MYPEDRLPATRFQRGRAGRLRFPGVRTGPQGRPPGVFPMPDGVMGGMGAATSNMMGTGRPPEGAPGVFPMPDGMRLPPTGGFTGSYVPQGIETDPALGKDDTPLGKDGQPVALPAGIMKPSATMMRPRPPMPMPDRDMAGMRPRRFLS